MIAASRAAAQVAPIIDSLKPIDSTTTIRLVPTGALPKPTDPVGAFRGMHGDSIYFLPERTTSIQSRPIADVQVQRLTGYHSYPGLGLFFGLIVGAAAGGHGSNEDGGLAKVGPMVAAGFFGFLVGATVHTPIWSPVSATIGASGKGIGLQLRLADHPQ